ncbi:MAG: metal ABC transporter ATP-binding protein [Chloroflexi bacterium]|nr:metal ABC transporter ATP-binding protein [Chloroflexota bacterium]
METLALHLTDISASYNGKRALDDIHFTIAQGERAAVVGPNGAGKSTLFKVIVGLMPHLTGDVLVHGHSHHAGDCPSIGYVPQREAVDWNFPVTVMDVVLMGRVKEIGWLRRAGRADREAAHEALAQVGMAELASRHIGDLSGGQQQRAFIARALAQRADVLLLDEPFGGVDVEAQNAIFNILDHLREQGVTVLLSTHDLEMATTRFDRLILLNHRLVADGPAESVLTPERLAAAYGGRLTFWQNGQPVTVTADDCCP